MILEAKKGGYLILDADYICHRSYYAYTNPLSPQSMLKTRTGLLSGVFFGFFSLFLRKIEEYNPEKVIVAWGDKRENLKRREMSSDYKSGRSTLPEDFFLQISDIQLALTVLPNSKVIQFLSPGYEADDIIATVVHKVTRDTPGKYVYIATRDKDMFQLVNDTLKVRVINLGIKANTRDEEFDEAKVLEKMEIPPKYLADYLALIGDTADGVIGLKGIGPKTAIKLLNDNGPIKDWFNNIEIIKASGKVKDILIEGRDQLKLNKKLVSLATTDVPLSDFSNIIAIEESGITLEDIFDKYQIQKISPKDLLISLSR